MLVIVALVKFQAKIRRRRKSKTNEGKSGNASAYTDDEGFGSCNDQPQHNHGPESLHLSLNGNLSVPNTTVTTPITPTTLTGKYYGINILLSLCFPRINVVLLN